MELLIGVHEFGLVLHGGLIDPDSYMRLLRIEQGLSHGHLVNIVQRDDSGTPLVIEWSRLFDAALVVLAAPFAPWLGWHRALFIGGVASGPLSAGLLGAGLAFASAPFSEPRFLWVAPVIGLLLPGIRGYAGFGIIHYHIIMLAAVALAAGFALRARNGDRTMALAAGVAGGFAIWIMPETMPFVLFAWIGLGWRWLHRQIGAAMVWLGAGFAGVLMLGTAVDPPHGGFLTAEIDRISIVYVVLGVTVLAVTALLAWLDRLKLTRGQRNSAGIAGALAAFGAWLAQYPSVALGPYGLMTPGEMHLFFGAMMETQPVHNFSGACLLLGPGVFALIYCLHRAWHARHQPQSAGVFLIAAAASLFGTALTARFVIFQQFPAGLAAALLPVALTEASKRLRARPIRAATARIGMIFTCLIVPYGPAVAIAAAHPAKPSKPAACAMDHIAALLAPASGQIVLTRVGDVPELLYRTKIIAVGSLYQHGIAGYLRARAAWRSPAEPHPSQAFLATRARFVLFCPAAHRYALVAGAPKNSLWNALTEHRAPIWLDQIGADKSSGFRLYRVLSEPN